MAILGSTPALAVFLASFLFVPSVEANAFLSRDLPALGMDTEGILKQLEKELGKHHRDKTEERADSIVEALRPTFQALPQSSTGRVDEAAVKYLLHRFFVERDGWYVLGVHNEGEAWNNTPASYKVEDDHITAGLFDDKVGQGLSLREVGVLASTLETYVHLETLERLDTAYRLNGLKENADLEYERESDIISATDTYMTLYVMNMNYTSVTAEEMDEKVSKRDKIYPTWQETADFIRGVRTEVVSASPDDRTTFATTMRVVDQISERYGKWQNRECLDVKNLLLKIEQDGTGRVPLSSFYEAALNGAWQFMESKEYLKQLGALDETVPNRPSVIIPNYINSPANCVASSKFYQVCCINECEALLGNVERKLSAPRAEPERIADIIEQLPSATVTAPRTLPASIRQRLDDIATHHGGEVPLHGRLFSQFLHHAFPRECPYPHLSGTSRPVDPKRWKLQTGLSPDADLEHMEFHIEAGKGNTDDILSAGELPWTAEEELFISRTPVGQMEAEEKIGGSNVGRSIALVFAACSMAVTGIKMATSASQALQDTPTSKVSI